MTKTVRTTLLTLLAALPCAAQDTLAFVCTRTPGDQLHLVRAGRAVPLAPGFASTRDARISFDGRRVLFAGKAKAADAWQIWELALAGGAPHRVATFAEDCLAPLYLPGGFIAFARRHASGLQIEKMPLAGGAAERLTFAEGDHVPSDVLADGRILFEKGGEVFTLYNDGSGVESYRCHHGPTRVGARQVASGDIVFAAAGQLARFTSLRAVQVPIVIPPGDVAAPIAELAANDWLLALRPPGEARFGIYRWNPAGGAPRKVLALPDSDLTAPVVVRPRTVPKRHPSALGNVDHANLLCLSVYTSREKITGAKTVRVWGTDGALGEAPVERDGSFYVRVPGDTPVRFELLDATGKRIAAEQAWWWTRRGEQRVCVGCHAGPERAPDNATPEVLLRSTTPVSMKGAR